MGGSPSENARAGAEAQTEGVRRSLQNAQEGLSCLQGDVGVGKLAT